MEVASGAIPNESAVHFRHVQEPHSDSGESQDNELPLPPPVEATEPGTGNERSSTTADSAYLLMRSGSCPDLLRAKTEQMSRSEGQVSPPRPGGSAKPRRQSMDGPSEAIHKAATGSPTALSPPTRSEGTPVQPNAQVAEGPSGREVPPATHAQQNEPPEPPAQQNEPPAQQNEPPAQQNEPPAQHNEQNDPPPGEREAPPGQENTDTPAPQNVVNAPEQQVLPGQDPPDQRAEPPPGQDPPAQQDPLQADQQDPPQLDQQDPDQKGATASMKDIPFMGHKRVSADRIKCTQKDGVLTLEVTNFKAEND